MVSARRIYDWAEKASGKVTNWLHPLAFPGRDIKLPPVFIVALPKSGSIYLKRALRRTLRVPVHHVSGGGMYGSCLRYDDLCHFEQGDVVTREHLQPTRFQVAMLAQYGIRRVVLHLRDPRDAIASWTHHMDSILERRGLRGVSLSCEKVLPESYIGWSFEDRLRWQVENTLPDFVAWSERWLDLADSSADVRFLITDYQDLARNNHAFVVKILDFYEIPYREDWISLPAVIVGRNNIRRKPGSGNDMPHEIFKLADAAVPASLCDRFGWKKA
jgi:hypothetical protein